MARAVPSKAGSAGKAGNASKPYNFRLPPAACQFLEEQAQASGESKTQVVVEALECLHQRQREELMAQGYQEFAQWNSALAESALPAAREALPE